MPPNRWNSEAVERRAMEEMKRRMTRATLLLVGDTKRLLTVGQPVKRSGRTLVGLDPSTAPDPPRKVSSRLFQSITNAVVARGKEVVGYVGSNVEYARRQELGFMGTDSLGRNVHQAARPFLRRSLRENIGKVVKALGGVPR